MQATQNAMYVVKGEEHVFTNNGSYMQLLDTMRARVKQKDTESIEGSASATGQAMWTASPSSTPSKDEVSIATLQHCKVWQSCGRLWYVWVHTVMCMLCWLHVLSIYLEQHATMPVQNCMLSLEHVHMLFGVVVHSLDNVLHR